MVVVGIVGIEVIVSSNQGLKDSVLSDITCAVDIVVCIVDLSDVCSA